MIGGWKGDMVASKQENQKVRRFWRLIPKYLKHRIPLEILEEIEKEVSKDKKGDRWRVPGEMRKYLRWKLFFPLIRTSTHLKLPEFGNCGNAQKSCIYNNCNNAGHVGWNRLASYFLTNEED